MDAPVAKVCSKCGEEKSFSCFEPRKTAPDGLRGQCRPCRNLAPNRRETFRKKRKTSEQNKKYATENAKKTKAHRLANAAIKVGAIVRQPCEVCGELKVYAHHCDYDRPLDVMWLCAHHHGAWHSEHGEGINAH